MQNILQQCLTSEYTAETSNRYALGPSQDHTITKLTITTNKLVPQCTRQFPYPSIHGKMCLSIRLNHNISSLFHKRNTFNKCLSTLITDSQSWRAGHVFLYALIGRKREEKMRGERVRMQSIDTECMCTSDCNASPLLSYEWIFLRVHAPQR